MAFHLFCDEEECGALIWKQVPGQEMLRPQWRFNGYDFCSEKCFRRYIIRSVLREEAVVGERSI